MKTKLFYILALFLIFSCKTESKKQSKYPRWIGDIGFDVKKDNSDFAPCNGNENIRQYFHLSGAVFPFEGEKIALMNIFKKKYQSIKVNETGWLVRIRFIVNCKGKTGRFRLISSNSNYKNFTFDERITNQLLNITKNLLGWKRYEKNNIGYDYYQYLIFKIEKGHLIEILP